LTFEDSDIRHLRLQLVQFITEQLKQSQIDGSLTEPLADLRRALDADVRASVATALTEAGFTSGAVRLDDASVKAIAQQLFQLREEQRLAALASAPPARAADDPPRVDDPQSETGQPDDPVVPKIGLLDRFRRLSKETRQSLIVVAIAAVAAIVLIYIYVDKMGGQGFTPEATPQAEDGATPLPASGSPYDPVDEPRGTSPGVSTVPEDGPAAPATAGNPSTQG